MQELEKKFTQSDMNGGLIFIATFQSRNMTRYFNIMF